MPRGVGADVRLVDTHAHLDFPQFAGEEEEVLRRAAAAGVAAVVAVGTTVAASRRAVELAAGLDGTAGVRVHAAAGIHPHETEALPEEAWAELEEVARHPRVVALGETGLDYHYDRPPRAAQEEAFRRHLDLARRLGLPVIVHAREAYADVYRVLREEGVPAGGVMHCFAGEEAEAAAALELGLFVSFAGPVTFKNAERLRRVAAAVPPAGLLVETDCPFLSPHPFRGQRNEPARVRLVVEALAEVHGLAPEELAELTAANAARLFRLDGGGAGP